MEYLVEKYCSKLVSQGLAQDKAPLACGRDAEIYWNKQAPEQAVLQEVMNSLNINSLIFSRPAFPYDQIINHLGRAALEQNGFIVPQDSETRTFLHEIPVIPDFSPHAIIGALRKNKGVIIQNRGIITFGTISPEQAFVTYSSICFSTFVKFYADIGEKPDKTSPVQKELALQALDQYLLELKNFTGDPSRIGPFSESEAVIAAMDEAGKATVASGMVDSFFGNISYRLNNNIYISQTGSSLDELPGTIDCCPMDDRMTTAITASSEYGAHKSVFEQRNVQAVLHGHPRCTVIMSMICGKEDCENKGKCHIACTEERDLFGIPVVPGEVGAGPRGIVNTLPGALKEEGAVIWGHGIFTVGRNDFIEAFAVMKKIEIRAAETVRSIISQV